jgi:hypothetical protein
MTDPPEPDLVAAWFNTPTWADSEAFLTAHPQLCGESGERLLARQAADHRDPKMKAVLEEHLALLRRCRTSGIQTAYRWWTALIAEIASATTRASQAEQAYLAGERAALDRAISGRRRVRELTVALGETRSSVVSHDLSRLLLERYRVGGERDDLDKAVDTAAEGLQRSAVSPNAWAELVTNLNRALRQQYSRDRRPASLDHGVALALRLIGHLTPDSVAIPAVLGGLAEVLRSRHHHVGAIEDLDAAIRALDQAVGIARRARDELPGLLGNAGGALYERFEQRGEFTDLDRAIELLDEGLGATPAGSRIRLGLLNDLAAALITRHEHQARSADLDRAISLLDEAAEWGGDIEAATHSRLCAAWLARYQPGEGNPNLLEQAIHHGQLAVRQTPADAPDRASNLVTLAHALRTWSEVSGDGTALAQAIDLYQQAVDLTPVDSPRRRDRLAILGAGRLSRYSLAGDDADLRAAEDLLSEVLAPGLPSATVAVPALANLAGGHWLRFERTGDLSALNRAVELYADAVRASPPGSAARPGKLSNLAGALQARARLTDNAHDFQQALENMQEAWSLAPEAGADRATYAANLGQMLRAQSARTRDPVPLDESINLLRATLAHAPESLAVRAHLHTALAVALLHRGGAADVPDAEPHLRIALDLTGPRSPKRPARLLDLGLYLAERHRGSDDSGDLRAGRDAFQRAYRLGIDSDVPSALRAAQALGLWAERRGDPAEAAQAFGDGVTAGSRLFGAQLLRVEKEAWLRVSADVHTRAAHNLLAAPERDGRAAILALERGRALLLSETTVAPQATLEALSAAGHAGLVRRYHAAAARLSAAAALTFLAAW